MNTIKPSGIDAVTGLFETAQPGDVIVGVPTDDAQIGNSAGYTTAAAALAAAEAAIPTLPAISGLAGTYSYPSSITVTNQGLIAAIASGSAPMGAPTTTNITPSLVGTGATGTQVSATKPSSLRIWLNESVTATIAGAATSSINLKICATNNPTESAWTTLGSFTDNQSFSLAVAIQGVQTIGGEVEFDLPAGWFYKLESSGTGTFANSIASGQQTVYG